MIFFESQIKELEGISRKERNELFRRNFWNVYNHWMGWVGSLLFAMVFGAGPLCIKLLLKYLSFWQAYITAHIPIIILFLISRALYLSAIVPYIRKDIKSLNNGTLSNGAIASEKVKD